MTEFQLDIRTLSFVTVLYSFVYGSGLLFVGYFQQSFTGIKNFGMAFIGISLGFFLLSLRGGVPDWISIVLANSAIATGFLLMSRGMRLFTGFSPIHPLIEIAMALAVAGLFVLFSRFHPSVSARVVVISFFLSIQSGLCAYWMIRGKTHTPFTARWITAVPFIIASLLLLLRGGLALVEDSPDNFMKAGRIHQISFLLLNFLINSTSFGVLWISGARLERALRNQASTDPLTKVFNRRNLEKIFQREMSRATRHAFPLSVIMVDIDHFKHINDTYGHQVGDVVLANVAAQMRANVRAQDFVVRYGGEEFLIIMPDTDLKQAISVAEKLRGVVKGGVLCPKANIRATASFGVSTFSFNESWESLTTRADSALYKAKKKGRDRVEIEISGA